LERKESVNIDPNELKDERLQHPKESAGKSGGAAQPPKALMPIAVAALVLGLVLAFFLYDANAKRVIRDGELNEQLAQINTQLGDLGQQLEAAGEHRATLEGGLGTLQENLGVTQAEMEQGMQQARQQTAAVRQEQQENVEQLNAQLSTKAETEQVATLGTETDTRFVQVDEQISEVKEEVATSREAIEKNWQELSSMGLLLNQQGQLIATNETALEELRKQGERDYVQFDARKKQRINVADIAIELRKADVKNRRADLRLFVDDKRIDRKKVYTNTPLNFYVGTDRVLYELVINQVAKDQITGYISGPLGKLTSTQGGLRRTAN